MFKEYSIFFQLICLFLLSFNLHAQSYETVTIYATEIPGLHQSDGNGEYDIILKNIPGLKYEIIYLPAARAIAMFKQGTNCAFSPANLDPEFFSWEFETIATNPMGIASIHIFSPKGKPVITNLNDLIGKHVGIRLGIVYGKTFESKQFMIYNSRSIENNIKKLDSEQIDYMVAYIPDAYTAFSNMNLEPYPFDINSPIAVHNDSLVCKGVSVEFIDLFNLWVKD